MMSSHTYVTPLIAVLALTLCWSAQTTLASPLPPPHPDLEQQLDSLLSKSPARPISTKDDLNPEDPASSPSHQEFLQDVLQDEQEVTENRESLPGGNHPLLDPQGTNNLNDVSPVQNRENLSDQAPAVVDVPIQKAAGAREKHPEAKLENSSPVLNEVDQKDPGEEFQQLNKMKEDDPENQLPSVVGNLHQQDLQEVTSSVKDIQDVQLQDSNVLHEGNQEEQDHDLNNNMDSQEEELQTLQQADTKDDDDDDDEEETDDLKHPLPPEEQNENEAAARELDSITPPGSFHTDDVYDGYDSESSDNDDDDDDDDVIDSEPHLWVKDGEPGELYPGEYPGGVSNIVDNPEASHFSSWWGMDDKQWPRHDLDDVMPAEGLGGVEVKRGQEEEDEEDEEEEDEEEGRFRPVRVVILNETLYLNSSVDDRLPKFQPVPLPVHFEDYDVNRDGMISLPELHYVSRAREGVRQAFRAADSDGDGWVDRSEFQVAGWGRPIMNYAPLPPPSQGTVDNPPLPSPPPSG